MRFLNWLLCPKCFMLLTGDSGADWQLGKKFSSGKKALEVAGLVLDMAMDWLVMCSGWIFVRLSTGHSLTHSLDHEEAKSCLNARQRHQPICTCSTLLVTEAFADTQNLVCEMIFCIPVMAHCLLLKLLQIPKILYVKWYSTYL